MNIILNTNELGYLPFLETPVDSFIIGLKGFCINQKYSVNIKELDNMIKEIKNNNKNLYLSINTFLLEKDLKRFKMIFNKIKNLDIDAFIVSDLGILNIFIENNLENKVILDLQTYVTNKYSAKSLLNLGVKRIVLSKEITLEDIKNISTYNNGKIEVLSQGYVPITFSKRPILKCYYEKYGLNKKGDTHYIKEENRDNYYYLYEEKDNLTIFNDKQYSLFPYLFELVSANIENFRIDANFLNEKEIKEYIDIYKKGIGCVLSKNTESFNVLKEEFEKKHTYDNPFMHNESFLLKEGK